MGAVIDLLVWLLNAATVIDDDEKNETNVANM